MNDLNFNIYNIIIIAGVIHGFIFSLIILINKTLKSFTNNFLAFTILSLALSNLQYWLIDTNIIPRYLYENNTVLYFPFEFLMLPFFYFFVKSYIQQKILKKQILYIFTPFLFSIFYLMIRNSLSSKILIVKFLNIVVEYISIIFSVVLIILIFIILKQYEKKNQAYKSTQVLIKTKWLKYSLTLGIVLCFLWALSFNLFENYLNKGYYKYYPLWIGISVLIYWIGYSAILQRHLYNERVKIRGMILNKPVAYKQQKNNIALSSFSKINASILKNKSYLNPNLSIKSLSQEFNLSEGYLSQLINKNSDSNFNDYINSLRIKESKEMLANPDYNNYTIAAIGLESGFNSKSSFYTAFKKFTGKTPTGYKKDVRNS